MVLVKKYFLYLAFFVFMFTSNKVKSQRDTLIYIGDPMCSWCYGFSPELDKVIHAFPTLSFEMVMGGLRAGSTETMGELKNFLTEHWIEVQKRSGQPFNFGILNQEDLYYDTELACRAVIVAGLLDNSKKYAYFRDAQKSFYFQNNNPNAIDTYIQIAMNLGYDGEQFHKMLISQNAKIAAQSDFALSNNIGVQGFPTLLLKSGENYYILTNGYRESKAIIKLIENKGIQNNSHSTIK